MKQELLLLSVLFAASSPIRPARAEFSFKMPGKIVFEAEAGKVKAPFEIVDLADSSGGKVVYLKERTNKKNPRQPGEDFFPGSIEYRFEVETEGKYMLWLRKFWLNGCANSAFFTINKPMTVDNAQILGEDGTYKKLTWIRLGDRPFHLKAGTNVLCIQNREDGVRLDQFAFCEVEERVNQQYVPQTKETATCIPNSK